MYRISKTWRPWLYQGHHRRRRYFEGWYYKLVDASGENIVAIIPGIAKHPEAHSPGSNSAEADGSHSFIQVFDGKKKTACYHRYPADSFEASKRALSLRIGNSSFTYGGIQLDIDDASGRVKGELTFSTPAPWPIKLFRPGYMGWYAFMPFMQCYHGVLSFDHSIQGSLQVNGRTVNFDGGRGYMEKDWGASFPRSWIWMQSNHFQEEEVSFMCSIATIPWLGSYFTGFGAGLWLKGAFYPFSKWNGTRLEALSVKENKCSFRLVHKNYRIKVEASGDDPVALKSPVIGKMEGTTFESLEAEISIRFEIRDGADWREVFKGEGRHGGLEIMGDTTRLVY